MITDMTLVQTTTVCIQSAAEILKVFPVHWRPCNLRESNGTRIHHILHLGIGIHIFRPVVTLNAQDMMSQSQRLDGIRYRIIIIGRSQISRRTRNGYRLHLAVALIPVEIHTVAARRHDDIMLLHGSLDTSFRSTP